MQIPSIKVALLLFGSGMAALVYQICWLRELRLIFGASTAASAAVLAIFMGGLGVGSSLLGKRVDKISNPLAFYASLEMSIAVYACTTPFISSLVRSTYFETGGTLAMGLTLSMLLRLVLSVGILGVPAFLMGGTLPAAARAVESAGDRGRRRLALLYGSNTLGAVLGAAGATFTLLNIFGTRNTIWIACLLNGLVAIMARVLSRSTSVIPEIQQKLPPTHTRAKVAVKRIFDHARAREIFLAAFLSGFTFFLMELVWYRMLGSILGGTTYTFGLILSTALLGIGIGGGLFSLRPETLRPTINQFAVVSALEAFFLALPYTMGDRLAVFIALINPLDSMGFMWRTAGWVIVAGLVVLPAATLSGFKFPLLIALLGKGDTDIGRHTGFTYAWNTLGAILGSLAGGFGLLTFLTSPGCWKLVVSISAVVSLLAAGLSALREHRRQALVGPVAVAVIAFVMGFAPGPSAVWRHSGIGTGRDKMPATERNQNIDWMNLKKRSILWETDGREASVGIDGSNGFAFVVNGKSDGNAKYDAGTQVMVGMISAILHPAPEKAMVIGLGTGSSAGWLGRMPSMQRVDAVEIEPSILKVASLCAPVNQNVLEQENVNIIIGDAREVLMTTRETYDLIVSEPSNPYRAGIASLYTREFYRSVADRLSEGGIFSQWIQAYEIRASTIRTILATLAVEFDHIEIWSSMTYDLVIVCSKKPIQYRVAEIRAKIEQEPCRSALLYAWGGVELEDFLSRFVAGPGFVKSESLPILEKGWLNTDDRMLIEFDLAWAVGSLNRLYNESLKTAALKQGEDRPRITEGEVDWERMERAYMLSFINNRHPIPEHPFNSQAHSELARIYNLYLTGDLAGIHKQWRRQKWVLYGLMERLIVAASLASAGDPEALALVAGVGERLPVEADIVAGAYYWKIGQTEQAIQCMERAFRAYRTNPWPEPIIMGRALYLAAEIARQKPEFAGRLLALLAEPFAVNMLNEERLRRMFEIAVNMDYSTGREILKQYEPHIPWQADILEYRYACYSALNDPMNEKAKADYEMFLRNANQGW